MGQMFAFGWIFFYYGIFLDLFGFLVVITIVDIFREHCIVKVLSLQLFGMAC